MFVGSFLLCLLSGGAYLVWNNLLRYEAYGEITGRVIRVPAPQGGNVRSIHVREGDHVRQGQLLLTLENVELEQRLSRIGDELLMAQANLDAEIAKLQWQTQQQRDQAQRAAADFFQLWGDLVQQQAKLDELQARLEREQSLGEIGALSEEELDETRFALAGQEAKVEKLGEALAERKKLMELSECSTSSSQLKPLFIKIETLQTEMSRFRVLIQQGRIRAPVAGRVVRTWYFTGEHVEAAQVVMELLEESSLEAVIYLPQERLRNLDRGQRLVLQLGPHRGKVPSEVERLGEQFITVPDGLQRYYHKSEQVLPVYARLHLDVQTLGRLQLGCEVRVPASWTPAWWPWSQPAAAPGTLDLSESVEWAESQVANHSLPHQAKEPR